jgi:hypothetical protein
MPRNPKPKLVTQYLENISREGFETHIDIIRKFVGGRMGVYALYRRGKLYYVGLASDLPWRMNHHCKNRHKDAWDTFSVYLTIGDQHLRELESLAIRVAQPPGNRQLGRFSGAQDLLREFDKKITAKQRAERDRIFGRETEEVEDDKGLQRSVVIRARYKGKLVWGRLRKDGRVRHNKKLYSAVSAAATAVRGAPTNGWNFWQYQRGPGEWVPIDKLRND